MTYIYAFRVDFKCQASLFRRGSASDGAAELEVMEEARVRSAFQGLWEVQKLRQLLEESRLPRGWSLRVVSRPFGEFFT